MESINTAIIQKVSSQRISVSINAKNGSFEEMLKIFRNIDKRFWDSQKKLWLFPASQLDYISKSLKEIGLTVIVKDFTPIVVIMETDEYTYVKSEFSPIIFEMLKQIKDSKWINETKQWRIPSSETETIILLLTNQQIHFCLSRESTPENKKPITSSPKAPRKTGKGL